MLLNRLHALRIGCVALALGGVPACQVILPSGPSNVAQGRYYSTGDPEYDDFFLRVFRLQLALKDAPKRLGEPRQRLADALSVGPDPSEIRPALAKRANELSNHGVHYTVARPEGPDKPPSLLATGNPTGKDFELKGLLEGALKGAGELNVDITSWKKELDELGARQSTLEGNVAEAFSSRSESQRTEIKQNLSDGGKIISLLVDRTTDLDTATTSFLKALTSALGETGPAAQSAVSEASSDSDDGEKKGHKTPPPDKPQRAASPAPKSAPASKSKSSGGSHAAPPPRAAPPPKPAPPAKPAKPEGGGEAPPAPKPTQGTAKPDFEP